MHAFSYCASKKKKGGGGLNNEKIAICYSASVLKQDPNTEKVKKNVIYTEKVKKNVIY